MREVEVTDIVWRPQADGLAKKTNVEYTGYFHGFGTKLGETMMIVESQDGSVKLVPLNHVRFLNKVRMPKKR